MYKSKTNQEGNAPKDPRHMYSNPLSPETCWITALALYLACRPSQPPGPLFPGSEQNARFGSILRQLVNDLKHQSHYGTHSIRKGVATYACSGSTGGPSIANVCLRVGWSLGGVQDRYIRYEAAGDQYLGRVVARLPLSRPEFAILPPHFTNNESPLLLARIRKLYPSLFEISSIVDIRKLCVASLVKHSVYLRATLPPSHPILTTALFRDTEMMNELNASLVFGDSLWMKPTGIPPHVEIYKQLQGVQQSIDNLPPVRLEGMSSLIESKGVTAGNTTKDLLESTIAKLLARVGLVRECSGRATTSSAEQHTTGTAHYYDGKFHMLPKSFEFPKTEAFGAWVL
ncbi:hypothetical protein F444_09989 [Phytophthora nicotianae P1976]|uniref:Uncharacterized protein n=1 Tax=Phytophthora nicotianae P1976 TaxID=1317066 RepID=A0A081A5P8_PHYNI|nr:hypothetical protein F444_09989 [Phytophthora nicotianae P1976]